MFNVPGAARSRRETDATSATFDQGQIILGGEAPFPEPNVEGHFGILGGTGAFRKARGEAILVVLSDGDIDTTFDLE